ncbi:MAG TPA: SDR family oxidoreductase [Methylomirabilota bacterium]|nr:SDR family oxidoreductase [Methylomirabilota bacterium]
MSRGRRVLITGAGRGLGLEFARRYLERGDQVFATCRRPAAARALAALAAAHVDRLTIVPLDVTDARSIHASHAAVGRKVDGLDLLINNAGMYSTRGSADPTERLGELRFEDALLLLRANAVGPLMVTQQYLDLVAAGRRARVVAISSEYGSVSENTAGFPYYYAASKAALNMLMRSLAAEVRRRGIVTALLDPGWVSTDMGGPEAPVTPARSVAGMMRVIDGLGARDNGRFFTWEGRPAPW